VGRSLKNAELDQLGSGNQPFDHVSGDRQDEFHADMGATLPPGNTLDRHAAAEVDLDELARLDRAGGFAADLAAKDRNVGQG
jgi:hypothetical protein